MNRYGTWHAPYRDYEDRSRTTSIAYALPERVRPRVLCVICGKLEAPPNPKGRSVCRKCVRGGTRRRR